MRRRENRHIRPKHAPIPNRHETAVQNRKVEVCIEALAQRNVAAVVNVEGRFDEDVVVAYVSDDALQHLETLGGEHVEARGGVGGGVREPGVELVGEGAGFEFCGVEGRVVGVVAYLG
jgi:hypothetical protein